MSFNKPRNLAIFSLAFSYPLELSVFLDNDLLSYGYFKHSFLQWFWCINFFYRVRRLHKGVPKVAKVLIPKSIPTELSVLGNT